MCAMENNRFEGYTFRMEYKPRTRTDECELLNIPGMHEGCVCGPCAADMTNGYRAQYVAQCAFSGETHYRVCFPCIWKDKEYENRQNKAWRALADEFYSECGARSDNAVAGQMCTDCLFRVRGSLKKVGEWKRDEQGVEIFWEESFVEDEQWKLFEEHLWPDGRLKTMYPWEEAARVVE
jgi:hypothetical protein